jgi:putative transport protein
MSSIMTVFLVIALGYLLGRISVNGFALGSSGIILVALIFGHFGYSIPKEIQDLGLICFVTAVGYIAGPVFFRNFRQKALAYIAIGFIVIFCAAVITVAAILICKIPPALGVGLMTGALTSTPGLAAAIEASGQNIASIGYGIGYPFGVLGVVLFVQIMPKLVKCDFAQETRLLEGNKTIQANPQESFGKRIRIDPHGFAPYAIAIVLGYLIGNIKIPLPGGAAFSLGISGGPLIVGLIAGHFGHIGPVEIRVPKGTLDAMREFGLSLFLLGAGLSAGAGFMEVLAQYGVGLFLIGIAITTLPMFVGYFFAQKVFKLSVFNALGSICGGMTSTPALGSLISVTKTDYVAASYAATYPIALICVVLSAQFICLLLGA